MKTETQISLPSENVEGMSTLSEVASLPSQEGDVSQSFKSGKK